MTHSKITKKFHLKKSFVAFIDILGFSRRFPNEKDSCIELLSAFAKYNGTHFDKKTLEERQVRAAVLCFSDNIGLSIPAKLNPRMPPDEFYRPLIAFLHAISFFTYTALSIGYYIRGAITYGEAYHTKTVIAGEPFIEAVEHEKIAHYPRIILTSSAHSEIEKFSQQSPYEWDLKTINRDLCFITDKVDNTIYFDWLNFYIKNRLGYESEINSTINLASSQLEEKILKEKDPAILQKLYWIKNYLYKFGSL